MSPFPTVQLLSMLNKFTSLRLLCDRCWLALALVRSRNDADVVVDTGLQPPNCIKIGGRIQRILQDGQALPGGQHRDVVPRNGGVVYKRPPNLDGGVGDVDVAEVFHLRHVWSEFV